MSLGVETDHGRRPKIKNADYGCESGIHDIVKDILVPGAHFGDFV